MIGEVNRRFACLDIKRKNRKNDILHQTLMHKSWSNRVLQYLPLSSTCKWYSTGSRCLSLISV